MTQRRKLSEICDLLNGYAFKSKNYVDNGIRIIRIANVQDGCIVDDAPCFYPSDTDEDIGKYRLHTGDLLVSLTGNVGRIGVLSESMLPAALNQRVCCLRVDNTVINRKYLFSTSVSLLDYDAVVVDVGFLAENCYGERAGRYENKLRLSDYNSSQIVEDFPRIKEQIVELLKQGRNIFLLMGENESCFVYTGEKQYSGAGKNARQTNIVRELDTYSFLPISIHATRAYGKKLSICCNAPYRDFLKQTADLCQYASYFSVKEPITVLANIKGTDKAVAAVIPYEKGKIVCLPQPLYEPDYKATPHKCQNRIIQWVPNKNCG